MLKGAFTEPDGCSPQLNLLYDNVVLNLVPKWILLQQSFSGFSFDVTTDHFLCTYIPLKLTFDLHVKFLRHFIYMC